MLHRNFRNANLSQVEDLASRGGLLYRQAGSPESAAQMLVSGDCSYRNNILNINLNGT